jgi:hypothetical protein
MVTGNSAVLILFGAVMLLGGYSLFKSMLPLWGFLIGGWLAYTFLPTFLSGPQANSPIVQAAAFIIVGLIFALLSTPLYYVIVFLSGAALGALMGVVVGALFEAGGLSTMRQALQFTRLSFPPIPQTPIQYILGAILGIIMGGVAINFQQFMIIASSSFLGSAALISGLIGPITRIGSTDMSRAAVMMMAWIVLAVLGMILQFRMSGEA